MMKKLILFLTTLVLITSCSTRKVLYNKHTTGSELIGGSFTMKDHHGKTVTNKTYQGQYTMVFFGFTHCATVCPIGMSTIGRVIHKLPQKLQDQIQPIFVSVDPERDDNKKVKRFVKQFNPKFIGLRGTAKQTQDMVNKYRGYYRKVYEDEAEYVMDHSDVIYFMDKQGRYINHFSSATGVDAIVDKINKAVN